MIHMYDDAAARRWYRGDFKVQLDVPNRQRPLGYCDGTAEDEAELLAMSEAEGEGVLDVHKRVLKTGREIWTLRTVGNRDDADPDPDE